MLDSYDETGQFNLKVSEPWYSLMLGIRQITKLMMQQSMLIKL